MTTYATNNPVGSTEVKDLYDNAENLDFLVNGPLDAYADRLGVSRKSWKGMENDFLAFLAASGFEPDVLDYVDGVPLQVDRPTQLIERVSAPGILYSVKLPSSFPVILSGTWATDEPLLVVRVDDSLRSELAAPGGAGIVGYGGGTVESALDDLTGEVAAISSAFLVADLNEMASGAVNTASLLATAAANVGRVIHIPKGTFNLNQTDFTVPVILVGEGIGSILRLADGAGGHLITSNASGLALSDLTLDQNRQNNPDRMKSAISFSGSEIYCRNVSFVNTMFAGIHAPNVAITRLTAIDCNWPSMAEHSGVMGEQTQAINCRTTTDCTVTIRGGSVTHPTPVDPDAAPGGFIFDGTAFQSVTVTGVTFRNIGQRKAANFIGAIDFYTGCRDCVITENKVFTYYYVPFKFQNCQRVVMSGNLVNGVDSASANQAVVFQNARDYQLPVVEFSCTGNVFIGTSQFTDAIYVQGDPDRIHHTERVTITGNVIRAFRYGINTSYVRSANMQGNDISLCVDGIFIRDVINGSTFSISGGRVANSSSRGIAAVGASGFQLNLTVSGVTLESNTSFHVDANFAARLTVSGCNLIGSPTNDVRSQNNGIAVITGCNNGTTSSNLSVLTGTLRNVGNSWNP